jgi:hypothetical protein
LLAKIHHPRNDSDNLSSFQESVKTATQTFYDAVCEQKSIKHFLFGISVEKIYENMTGKGTNPLDQTNGPQVYLSGNKYAFDSTQYFYYTVKLIIQLKHIRSLILKVKGWEQIYP